jgi:hypothetical protein
LCALAKMLLSASSYPPIWGVPTTEMQLGTCACKTAWKKYFRKRIRLQMFRHVVAWNQGLHGTV